MSMSELLREAAARSDASRSYQAEGVKASSPMGAINGNPAPGIRNLVQAREQELHLSSIVYTAVRPIAQKIARQPMVVARKRKTADVTGAKGKRCGCKARRKAVDTVRPLPTHPLMGAYANPNPMMTTWHLIYITVVSLKLTGLAYWLPRETDEGLELWPIPSSWVYPENDPDTDRPIDRYTVRPWNTGQEYTVDADDMLRIHLPHPRDPYTMALGPLEAASRSVRANEQMEVAQYRAMENGIYPGYAVKIGRHPELKGGLVQRPILSKEQREQLIEAVKQRWRGAGRAGEPVIIDGMIEEIQKITASVQEMDFGESTAALTDKIMMLFGTNPIICGRVEGANRAQAYVASKNFIDYTVNPDIELLSQALTKFFAAWFDDPDLLVFIEEAKPHDDETDRADREQDLKYGLLTYNEARADHGRPPIDGGDVLVRPVRQGDDKRDDRDDDERGKRKRPRSVRSRSGRYWKQLKRQQPKLYRAIMG